MPKYMNEESEYFCYSATLRIFSEEGLNFEEIEKSLELSASKSHRKGEKRTPISKEYQHDMWQLTSGLSEDAHLQEHLFKLWEKLKPHKEFLLRLRQRATVDIFCGYRSNCDHAGIEVDHKALEIFRELEIDFGLSIIVV